jgi:large subunit ribosomal protein L17
MRHRKAGRNLSRETSHRQAMLRNMVTSLFRHEQLETTDAKAKELRPIAEKMITLAKRGDLHARRQALATLRDKAVTHRLFEEVKDRYLDRQGGYVRIVKKEYRKGDGAPVSIVQLIAEEGAGKKTQKKLRKEASPGTQKKERKPGKEAKVAEPGEEVKKGTEASS